MPGKAQGLSHLMRLPMPAPHHTSMQVLFIMVSNDEATRSVIKELLDGEHQQGECFISGGEPKAGPSHSPCPPLFHPCTATAGHCQLQHSVGRNHSLGSGGLR